MNVRGHAPAVVTDLQRTVLMQDHIDLIGPSGDRLIDTVVDDLLTEMVGTPGVGIHPGSAFDRVEPLQYLEGCGVIILIDVVLLGKKIGRLNLSLSHNGEFWHVHAHSRKC